MQSGINWPWTFHRRMVNVWNESRLNDVYENNDLINCHLWIRKHHILWTEHISTIYIYWTWNTWHVHAKTEYEAARELHSNSLTNSHVCFEFKCIPTEEQQNRIFTISAKSKWNRSQPKNARIYWYTVFSLQHTFIVLSQYWLNTNAKRYDVCIAVAITIAKTHHLSTWLLNAMRNLTLFSYHKTL